MKLAIVGGHLSPALAVIDALPRDAQVLFIGRKYTFEGDRATSLEYNTIRSLKIPFASISTGRWQRKFTRFTIPSLFKFPYGVVQSFLILRNFKPEVVLSFGGYLSLPVGLSAFFLRIPIVIHEQTLAAGLANRILSFFAKKICISWDSSVKFFLLEKTVLTGNPVRKFKVHPDSVGTKFKVNNENKTLPIIYITGGSSGSHFINTLVEGCIEELLKKFIIIHQTGDAQKYLDFDRLYNLRNTLPPKLQSRYFLTKFVEPENIGSVIKAADLVVSRAGINTVTELIFFKKPSFLIPIPFSQNNEQKKNALFLKDLGLGEVFYQDLLDSKKFFGVLIGMFDNIDKYKAKSNLDTSINKNAAQKIIEVLTYAKKTKR
jgi:UDP-N-acetylglucosamine--N-acetylmuramyl-(pentapeptide) pyrophosphoryl-undecaprenol N-acetylglucosamine transferase